MRSLMTHAMAVFVLSNYKRINVKSVFLLCELKDTYHLVVKYIYVKFF